MEKALKCEVYRFEVYRLCGGVRHAQALYVTRAEAESGAKRFHDNSPREHFFVREIAPC